MSKKRNGIILPFNSEGLDSNKSENGVKYHYTSPEAFLSILQNRYVRFSDVRFMNDTAEKINFVKVLLEFLEDNPTRYHALREVSNTLLRENNFDEIKNLKTSGINYTTVKGFPYREMRIFLFCSSGHTDALNMWNYYVNNGHYEGYNIGINMEKFLDTFDTGNTEELDSFEIRYGNVLYKKADQYKKIERLAERIEDNIDEIQIEHLALSLRQYIETEGLFFKNKAFEAENEFRIIMSIANDHIPHSTADAEKYFGDNNKMMYEGFCTKKGLVVPYLNIKLPIDAISRITTAPMTEHDLAKLSVREVLNIGKYQGVQIHSSKIPIRF